MVWWNSIGLGDWYKIGRSELALYWGIGDGLADWLWIGGLVMD